MAIIVSKTIPGPLTQDEVDKLIGTKTKVSLDGRDQREGTITDVVTPPMYEGVYTQAKCTVTL